ncbi:MAG TPA: hypothetical protein VKU91_00305, partial [Acidimicrobiales bacterium]|nr:hypothetical protein [Acidimicrobiales bacterium]
GPIRVGCDCRIGANAVLVKDLPDGSTYTVANHNDRLERRVAQLERRLSEAGLPVPPLSG